MPVGRVFNAAQNQVLISPVSAYYEGKAKRADIELRELQVDAAKQELKDAPAKKAAANAKAAADYALVLESVRAKRQSTDAAEMDEARDIVSPWVQEYDKRGIKWARDNFDEMVLSRLPKSKRAEFAKAKGPDGVLDEGDMAKIGLMIAIDEVDKSPDPTSHQKMVGDLVERGVITQAVGDQILLDIEKKAGTIVGRTPEDIRSDPRTKTQFGAAYEEDLASTQASGIVIELISSALPRVKEMPGAVGARGKIGLGVAGFLSSLGQEELSAWAAESIAGEDMETIAAMQTQLQTIRGRIIELLTGEGGSRISENERQIAGTAVGIIERITGPADLAKAYPQVIGAMRQLMEESWASIYMKAKGNPDLDYPHDLGTKQGTLEWQDEMKRAGIDGPSIKRAYARLRKIQGVQ